MTNALSAAAPLFRIDKFIVPDESLSAFLQQIRRTHDTLGTLPGCLRNLILTQFGGPGEFNVVTLVEWVNKEAIANAVAVVEKQFANDNFDRKAFLQQLGVRADLGVYQIA